MTFDYIVNPETQRKVSIFSTKGRSILRNYLKVQNAGATECKGKSHGDCKEPCRWNPSRQAKGRKRKDGTSGEPYEVKAHCRKYTAPPRRARSASPKRRSSHCAGDVRPPCPADCTEYTYTNRKTGAKERRCRKTTKGVKRTHAHGREHYGHTARSLGRLDVSDSDSHSHEGVDTSYVGRPAEFPHGGSPRYYY
jgi:hypothetical protein